MVLCKLQDNESNADKLWQNKRIGTKNGDEKWGREWSLGDGASGSFRAKMTR